MGVNELADMYKVYTNAGFFEVWSKFIHASLNFMGSG